MAQRVFNNRITRLLQVDIPIANAPMGGVALAELVTAMAECPAIVDVLLEEDVRTDELSSAARSTP